MRRSRDSPAQSATSGPAERRHSGVVAPQLRAKSVEGRPKKRGAAARLRAAPRPAPAPRKSPLGREQPPPARSSPSCAAASVAVARASSSPSARPWRGAMLRRREGAGRADSARRRRRAASRGVGATGGGRRGRRDAESGSAAGERCARGAAERHGPTPPGGPASCPAPLRPPPPTMTHLRGRGAGRGLPSPSHPPRPRPVPTHLRPLPHPPIPVRLSRCAPGARPPRRSRRRRQVWLPLGGGAGSARDGRICGLGTLEAPRRLESAKASFFRRRERRLDSSGVEWRGRLRRWPLK